MYKIYETRASGILTDTSVCQKTQRLKTKTSLNKTSLIFIFFYQDELSISFEQILDIFNQFVKKALVFLFPRFLFHDVSWDRLNFIEL